MFWNAAKYRVGESLVMYGGWRSDFEEVIVLRVDPDYDDCESDPYTVVLVKFPDGRKGWVSEDALRTKEEAIALKLIGEDKWI